ncbi:hypothetical protein N7471_003842 [Penicillium samsonianum]|uniref:uncharacterized protein n=1 Tax=Penicillium samsonianum TaxID=1882272 RepID=UPI0025492C84|nr:uncharacterized protein N7471_003842 [Penicillium samsonianum]KAJ6137356.1 hypothetical protein N7471_003842 [Penicillium samsonianum]
MLGSWSRRVKTCRAVEWHVGHWLCSPAPSLPTLCPIAARAQAIMDEPWEAPARQGRLGDKGNHFTPDPTSDVHVRTFRGTTYYTNVYAFVNQLKALVPLKSEEVVRANLPSCLREAAARWYSAELSEEERQDLSVGVGAEYAAGRPSSGNNGYYNSAPFNMDAHLASPTT